MNWAPLGQVAAAIEPRKNDRLARLTRQVEGVRAAAGRVDSIFTFPG